VAAVLPPREWVAHPVAGTFSLVAARLGWRLEEVACLGLHAAPFARLRPVLARGVRAICTLRDGAAVADLSGWLATHGFGACRVTVCEEMGGPNERLRDGAGWPDIAAPVAVALDGADLPRGAGLPRGFGLADDCFAHDGQITKAPVRAITLSALAPRAGELLWDIGGGSGSVSVEWGLAGGRAVCIEAREDRATNIRRNAETFGLSHRLNVVHGRAPQALDGLPPPDAVFVGGGGDAALQADLWPRLPPGARLVANAVTLEGEAVLAGCHARHGGRLVRIDLAEAAPLGGFRGWQAARPIVQWSVTA
jgi:precorrin-6Y C5,15-methyltransferase (decarboxylating)